MKRRGALEGPEAGCQVGDGGGGEGGGVWAAEDLWRRHDTLLAKNIFSKRVTGREAEKRREEGRKERGGEKVGREKSREGGKEKDREGWDCGRE